MKLGRQAALLHLVIPTLRLTPNPDPDPSPNSSHLAVGEQAAVEAVHDALDDRPHRAEDLILRAGVPEDPVKGEVQVAADVADRDVLCGGSGVGVRGGNLSGLACART